MDFCDDVDDIDNGNRGVGALSRDEGLIVMVYVLTIALLLVGPQFLFAEYFKKRSVEPPFILERTSYAPMCGLILLAIIPTQHSDSFEGIVTAKLIGDVFVDQVFVVVSKHYDL